MPDLSHAVRTGRVGMAQAAIGSLLKIVPVLKVGDGSVNVEARVRTFSRAQETIVDATVRDIGDVTKSRVLVVHAHALPEGEALLERLRSRLVAEPAYCAMAEAGPAIAAHAGEGALGIFSIAG